MSHLLTMFHGPLLSFDNKMNLGEPYCTHRGKKIETILHITRDCPLENAVWLVSLDNRD
jgi:hypothetical protein